MGMAASSTEILPRLIIKKYHTKCTETTNSYVYKCQTIGHGMKNYTNGVGELVLKFSDFADYKYAIYKRKFKVAGEIRKIDDIK